MHSAVVPQQLAAVVQWSPALAQPVVDDWHTGAAASPEVSQYPPQQSTPDWHPCPSPRHGESAQ